MLVNSWLENERRSWTACFCIQIDIATVPDEWMVAMPAMCNHPFPADTAVLEPGSQQLPIKKGKACQGISFPRLGARAPHQAQNCGNVNAPRPVATVLRAYEEPHFVQYC